jgi:hypothetical protein
MISLHLLKHNLAPILDRILIFLTILMVTISLSTLASIMVVDLMDLGVEVLVVVALEAEVVVAMVEPLFSVRFATKQGMMLATAIFVLMVMVAMVHLQMFGCGMLHVHLRLASLGPTFHHNLAIKGLKLPKLI